VRTSVGWLLADAAAPVVGAGAAQLLSIPQAFMVELSGIFAGSFLFIGGAHLLPEGEQEGSRPWLFVSVLAGFGFIFVVTHILKE
jgi:ZIP family zinc transporter